MRKCPVFKALQNPQNGGVPPTVPFCRLHIPCYYARLYILTSYTISHHRPRLRIRLKRSYLTCTGYVFIFEGYFYMARCGAGRSNSDSRLVSLSRRILR